MFIPGRYSSRPCKVPASHSLRRHRTRPLRFRVRRLRSFACLHLAKPSGRPGHGRPGRWRSICQSVPCLKSVPASNVFPEIIRVFPGRARHNPVPASHTLRGYARISVVASCSYSKAGACSRSPWYPARTSVPRSLPWAVPAQAGEAVFPPALPVSVGGLEPKVSSPLSRRSPPAPTHQTASPATLHFVPRPMALPDS